MKTAAGFVTSISCVNRVRRGPGRSPDATVVQTFAPSIALNARQGLAGLARKTLRYVPTARVKRLPVSSPWAPGVLEASAIREQGPSIPSVRGNARPSPLRRAQDLKNPTVPLIRLARHRDPGGPCIGGQFNVGLDRAIKKQLHVTLVGQRLKRARLPIDRQHRDCQGLFHQVEFSVDDFGHLPATATPLRPSWAHALLN